MELLQLGWCAWPASRSYSKHFDGTIQVTTCTNARRAEGEYQTVCVALCIKAAVVLNYFSFTTLSGQLCTTASIRASAGARSNRPPVRAQETQTMIPPKIQMYNKPPCLQRPACTQGLRIAASACERHQDRDPRALVRKLRFTAFFPTCSCTQFLHLSRFHLPQERWALNENFLHSTSIEQPRTRLIAAALERRSALHHNGDKRCFIAIDKTLGASANPCVGKLSPKWMMESRKGPPPQGHARPWNGILQSQ
eukprot:6476730-Amphidinium_carterae.1